MNNTNLKFKIVADSSSDVIELSKVEYAVAPLKIITDTKEYVDNKDLDVKQMADDLLHYNGKSSSSCPNPNDWLNCFDDAERIFCVTITSNLSGSYNSACIAKNIYEEKHPDRKVFVIDSLSAGPELKLIIEKLEQLISEGTDFDKICSDIKNYQLKTGLLFMLESLKNLANNGRVSHLTAKAAGILGIRLIGKASDEGTLEPIAKCRGENKALDTIIEQLKKLGYNCGKIHISHCFNENAAHNLKNKIITEWNKAKVEIYNCKGLCSFYAEMGGMLIGFETV